MATNWARLFNRLFELINSQGPAYLSGGMFIAAVREVDPYFPDYNQFIEQRRRSKKSTSRKNYFYDILLSFPEENRSRVVLAILDKIQSVFPEKTAEIRVELSGAAAVPPPAIPRLAWKSDRLSRYLLDIDSRISSGNYEGAVTLGYTCLEGFLKAFVHQNLPEYEGPMEILSASKAVKSHLRQTLGDYPDEALAMLTHIAYTVDRTRNGFSESHFDKKAAMWLAVFIRDLVNSDIRLLLHFM